MRVIAYLVIAASINACGFQLRGSIDLADTLSPIYIEQNSAFELAREIKSLLVANKIKVVNRAGQSNATLSLLNEEKTRRTLSVDGSGRVREYRLSYRVNFVIDTKQSASAAIEKSDVKNNQDSISQGSIPQDSISLSRSLLFDPDAVLAVTNEAEILYEDMRRDAARLILLKLQARSKNSVNK